MWYAFRRLAIWAVALSFLFASVDVRATDKEWIFKFVRPDLTVSNAPIVTEARTINATNGVAIRAFSVAMSSGRMDNGLETFSPQEMPLKINVSKKMANQMDAYASPYGLILVPKNWVLRNAGVGFDGSTTMLFSPNTKGQSFLLYENDGACAGCAETSASLFFSEARRRAKEDDFLYMNSSKQIKAVYLTKLDCAYSITTETAAPVDGVAHYDGDADFQFFNVKLSAPKLTKEVRTALLNQFLAKQ